jgi:hypothetical protein
MTADSRANIRAVVRLAGSINEAVKSPVLTSSKSARATSALASAAMVSGVKSAVKMVITCNILEMMINQQKITEFMK